MSKLVEGKFEFDLDGILELKQIKCHCKWNLDEVFTNYGIFPFGDCESKANLLLMLYKVMKETLETTFLTFFDSK